MPFCARPVLPEELSRRRNGDSFATLDEVTNHSLCKALVQLASLCSHTESIFESLQTQQCELGESLNRATRRINNIKERARELNPTRQNEKQARLQEECEIAARCGAPQAQFQLAVENHIQGGNSFGHRSDGLAVEANPFTNPVTLLGTSQSRRAATSKRRPIWHSKVTIERGQISQTARPHHIDRFVETDQIPEEHSSLSNFSDEISGTTINSDLALVAAIGASPADLTRYNTEKRVRASYREAIASAVSGTNSGRSSPRIGFDTLHRHNSQRARRASLEERLARQERCLKENVALSQTFLQNGTLNPKEIHRIQGGHPERETVQIDFDKQPPRQGSGGIVPPRNPQQPRIRLGRTPAYQMARSASHTSPPKPNDEAALPTSSSFHSGFYPTAPSSHEGNNPQKCDSSASGITTSSATSVANTSTTAGLAPVPKAMFNGFTAMPRNFVPDGMSASKYDNVAASRYDNVSSLQKPQRLDVGQNSYVKFTESGSSLADGGHLNAQSPGSAVSYPDALPNSKSALQRKIRENYLRNQANDQAPRQTVINYFTPPRQSAYPSVEETSSKTLITPTSSPLCSSPSHTGSPHVKFNLPSLNSTPVRPPPPDEFQVKVVDSDILPAPPQTPTLPAPPSSLLVTSPEPSRIPPPPMVPDMSTFGAPLPPPPLSRQPFPPPPEKLVALFPKHMTTKAEDLKSSEHAFSGRLNSGVARPPPPSVPATVYEVDEKGPQMPTLNMQEILQQRARILQGRGEPTTISVSEATNSASALQSTASNSPLESGQVSSSGFQSSCSSAQQQALVGGDGSPRISLAPHPLKPQPAPLSTEPSQLETRHAPTRTDHSAPAPSLSSQATSLQPSRPATTHITPTSGVPLILAPAKTGDDGQRAPQRKFGDSSGCGRSKNAVTTVPVNGPAIAASGAVVRVQGERVKDKGGDGGSGGVAATGTSHYIGTNGASGCTNESARDAGFSAARSTFQGFSSGKAVDAELLLNQTELLLNTVGFGVSSGATAPSSVTLVNNFKELQIGVPSPAGSSQSLSTRNKFKPPPPPKPKHFRSRSPTNKLPPGKVMINLFPSPALPRAPIEKTSPEELLLAELNAQADKQAPSIHLDLSIANSSRTSVESQSKSSMKLSPRETTFDTTISSVFETTIEEEPSIGDEPLPELTASNFDASLDETTGSEKSREISLDDVMSMSRRKTRNRESLRTSILRDGVDKQASRVRITSSSSTSSLKFKSKLLTCSMGETMNSEEIGESALSRLAKPVSIPLPGAQPHGPLMPPMTPFDQIRLQETLQQELKKDSAKSVTSTLAMKSLEGVQLRSERPPLTKSSRYNMSNTRTPPRPLSMLLENESGLE